MQIVTTFARLVQLHVKLALMLVLALLVQQLEYIHTSTVVIATQNALMATITTVTNARLAILLA